MDHLFCRRNDKICRKPVVERAVALEGKGRHSLGGRGVLNDSRGECAAQSLGTIGYSN